MLKVAPVRKGTPTRSMKILYDLEPLHLHIKRIAMSTYIRIGPKSTWLSKNPSMTGHISYTREMLPMKLRNVQLDKKKYEREWNLPYKVIIGNRLMPDWCPTEMSSEWACFTDGSRQDNRSGAGVVFYTKGSPDIVETINERQKRATVYQSELRAIQMAAKWFIENNVQYNIIDFYVNNQAALRSVSALSCRQIMTELTRKLLTTLGSNNILKLTYVRAHKGQVGNENADQAARDGNRAKLFGPDVPLALANAKQMINDQIRKNWSKEWCTVKGHRQSKYFLKGPDPKFKTLIKYSKNNISTLIRAVTGHSFMKRHQNEVINGDNDTLCRLCMEEVETPHHIITECPVLLHRRKDNFGKMFLNEIFTWIVQDMFQYLDATVIKELEEDDT